MHQSRSECPHQAGLLSCSRLVGALVSSVQCPVFYSMSCVGSGGAGERGGWLSEWWWWWSEGGRYGCGGSGRWQTWWWLDASDKTPKNPSVAAGSVIPLAKKNHFAIGGCSRRTA